MKPDLESRSAQAVVAGYLCLDFAPGLEDCTRPEDLLRPGDLIHVGPARLTPGGVVANTGLALHDLGVPVTLIGKIGADPVGAVLREIFESRSPGLSQGLKVSEGDASAYAVVVSPLGRDRCFWACPGANRTFGSADIDYDLLPDAGVFHFGYPPLLPRMLARDGAEMRHVFERARARGLATSLDMCTPEPGIIDWAPWLENVLPTVDLFLPSLPELMTLLPLGDAASSADPSPPDFRLLQEYGDRLLGLGCALVMIKLGARGLYLRTAPLDRISGIRNAIPRFRADEWADRELYVPAYRVVVRSANGAGDCAAAGFISGLLRGEGPGAALRRAAGAGALRVETPDGPLDGSALEQRLAAGWEAHAVSDLPAHWMQNEGVWTCVESAVCPPRLP